MFPKRVWKETLFVEFNSFFPQIWCVDNTTQIDRLDSISIKNIRLILAFGEVTTENHRKCEQKSNDEQNPSSHEDVYESSTLQLDLKG